MVDIYQYIAENDQNGCKMIANQYGYSLADVQTADDMADVLEDLVAREGETAFYQVLDMHPDKQVILEVYGKREMSNAAQPQQAAAPCGCKDKAAKHGSMLNQGFTMQQGNLFLIAAALLLSVAIITRKS